MEIYIYILNLKIGPRRDCHSYLNLRRNYSHWVSQCRLRLETVKVVLPSGPTKSQDESSPNSLAIDFQCKSGSQSASFRIFSISFTTILLPSPDKCIPSLDRKQDQPRTEHDLIIYLFQHRIAQRCQNRSSEDVQIEERMIILYSQKNVHKKFVKTNLRKASGQPIVSFLKCVPKINNLYTNCSTMFYTCV